jgi:hypothetical protein
MNSTNEDDERSKISEEMQKLILEQLCARTPIRVFFRKLPVVPIPKTDEEKYKVDIPIEKLSTERPKPLSYDNVPLYGIIHTWSIYTEPSTINSKYPNKRLFPFIEFPPRESYIVDKPSICIHPSTVSKMMYYVYNCIYSKNNCYKVKSICTSGFKNLYVETWPGCPQKDRTLLIDIITAEVTNLTSCMDESALAKVSSWIPDPTLSKYSLSLKELQELSPDQKPRRRPTGKRTNRSFGAISGELSTVETDVRNLPQESEESTKDKEISEQRKLALIDARKNIVQCCHPEHTSNNSWCIKINSFICPTTGATICKRHLDEVVDSLKESLSDTGFPKHRWFPICPIYYLIQNKEKDLKVSSDDKHLNNRAFNLVQQHKPHRLDISFSCLVNNSQLTPDKTNEVTQHSLNTLVHPCEFLLIECNFCYFPNRCNQLTTLKPDCSPNQLFKDYHYKCVRCGKNQCIRCQKLVQMCSCWGAKSIGSESIDKNLFLSSICDPFDDTCSDEKVFEYIIRFADEQPVGHLRMLAMFTVRLNMMITSLYLRCKNNVCSKCASKVVEDIYQCVRCTESNHITCLNCGTHLNKDIVEGDTFCYEHRCFGFLPIVSQALDEFRYNNQNTFSYLINQFDNLSARRFLGLLVSFITKFLRYRNFLIKNRSESGFRKALIIDHIIVTQAFSRHPWWDNNMSNFIQRTWILCEDSLQYLSQT